jgi:hypothetical protein
MPESRTGPLRPPRQPLRFIRYALAILAGVVVLALGAVWVHRRAMPLIPKSPETGGREAFRAFLTATDSGVSVEAALRVASPAPAIVPPESRPPECAIQYRWTFTESGSEYGTACVDSAGHIVSTGGGMQFDLRSY